MAEIGMEDRIRMLIIKVTEFTNGLVIVRNAGLSFFQGINTLDNLDEFESFKKEMAPYLDKIEKNLRAVGY